MSEKSIITVRLKGELILVVKGTFLEIFSLRAPLGVKIKIAILWFRTWFRDTTGGFAVLRNRFLAAKPVKPGFAVVSHGFAGLGFAREVVSQPKKIWCRARF